MKILLAHNFYQQPGGEDQVFSAEASLLEKYGHKVIRYTRHNAEIENLSKGNLAKISLWNRSVYKELKDLLRKEHPDVAHFHNTFPLFSPAAYYAARSENVPVVQTLHNYRLCCPNAIFYRAGKPCELCVGKFLPWPGVIHACYRGDYASSSVVALMLAFHKLLQTWKLKIDTFIALTEFAKERFIQGGLPKDRIVIKPNFVSSPPEIGSGQGKYALFIGRLSQEKGVETLLAAWKYIRQEIPLKIIGDGPLRVRVANACAEQPEICWLGQQPPSVVYDLLGEATFLICPSEWYESCPLVILEAFAKGTPVLASRIGAISELVEDGVTGFQFSPGDAKDLARQVKSIVANPNQVRKMRKNARREFENRYTEERNYQLLIKIYETLQK